jgi:hypothetical protein
MTKRKTEPPVQTHEQAVARRIGPGAYRAECRATEGGCGWDGLLRQGHWWEARKQAEQDADEHAGRAPRPAAKGPTPSRPVRIPDRLWLPVVQVADEEGTSASAILREALERDPRVAAILAGEGALAPVSA